MSDNWTAYGQIRKDVSATGSTPAEAAKALYEQHDANAEWIAPESNEDAGFSVMGFCESCEAPIREGEQYASDQDGIMECEKCLEKYRAEEGSPHE